MKALTGIIVVALAACSTPSEVVKTGPNAYRVRTNAGGGNPNDTEIKTRGIARANEFCDAQGKRAVINVGQSSAWHLFSIQTAEVQFFCDDRLPPRAVSAIPEAAPASGPAATASAGAPTLSAGAGSPLRAASASSAP
jgi:hypothetical protein